MTKRLLNPYQRNSVVVTLRTAETILRSALGDLTSQDEGILYRRSARLTDNQREQVKQLAESALAEVAHLAQTLDLPVEDQNNAAALHGQLAVLWSDLHEIRAKELRRYGEVAPELEMVLTPPLMRLIQSVTKLMDTLDVRKRR